MLKLGGKLDEDGYLLGLNMFSQIVIHCKSKILNYTVGNSYNTMIG